MKNDNWGIECRSEIIVGAEVWKRLCSSAGKTTIVVREVDQKGKRIRVRITLPEINAWLHEGEYTKT